MEGFMKESDLILCCFFFKKGQSMCICVYIYMVRVLTIIRPLQSSEISAYELIEMIQLF